MQLLWREVLLGKSAWKKTVRLAHIVATQHQNNEELINLRCDRGAQIVRKIGLAENVANAVCHLDEHWDGSGYPNRFKKSNIPLLSRLMGVAQHLDAFCMEKGTQVAIDTMLDRSGRWFDPTITRVAHALHQSGDLWNLCTPGADVTSAHQAVLDQEPDSPLGFETVPIDQICEAFADVVDAKSPFTFRHSHHVKDIALAIGTTMGLPSARLQMLRRAALLHDIGKLSVPNSILDKPGNLTETEFQVIASHSRLSREILGRISAFDEIAVIAGNHHEKLDGSGYPNHLLGEQLPFESRLIAVADVYGALSEIVPIGKHWIRPRYSPS